MCDPDPRAWQSSGRCSSRWLRLACTDEREAQQRFGEEYRRYAGQTPAFIPRFGQLAPPGMPVDSSPRQEQLSSMIL